MNFALMCHAVRQGDACGRLLHRVVNLGASWAQMGAITGHNRQHRRVYAAHAIAKEKPGNPIKQGVYGLFLPKAPPGFEPGMADLQSAALATWLRRLMAVNVGNESGYVKIVVNIRRTEGCRNVLLRFVGEMRFEFAISAMFGTLPKWLGNLAHLERKLAKDAQQAVILTDEARQKFEECVVVLAACGFGPDGPAKDTTFVEIEEFGHEVGRMVAQAVDEQLASQHAAYFQEETPCPTCEAGPAHRRGLYVVRPAKCD